MRTKLTISKAIKRAAPRFVLSFSFLMISVLLFAFFSFNNQALANVKPDMPTPGGTVMPDLFTGVMGYRIPIEVPPGRQGVQPGFALIYRSPSRNGWLGVGWDLEVGSIERRTKFGVDYDADDFVLRMSGATIDLINIGNDEYGARIEGGFYRIKKLSSTDGLFYWEVTDKIGMRYLYGQETEYRQHDPSDPTRIFKWCLDQVVDTSGNFMTFTYSKDLGQIYLDRIDYTGNGAIDPTNYVKFHLESRDDAPIMSTANFDVKTAYRLKTIELVANGNPVRAYKLQYDTDPNTPDPDYSVSTGRSVLMSVQQFGKDYALDGDNTVIAGSTLPAIELMHSAEENGLEEQEWTTTAPYWGASNLTYVGDFDGDGNDDIATVKIGACGIIGCMSTVWVKRSIGDSFIEERWADVTFGSYNYWVGDFNGDGKSDIAYTWTMKLYVLKSTGSSFVSESWTANAGNWGGTIAYVRIGDFNGDGKSDISTTSGGDGTIWVKRSTGYSFEEEVWTTTAPTWGASNRTFIGDFDGDGKDDIATVKLQLFCVLGCGYVPTFWVKHSNGSSFIEEKWSDGFPFPLLPYNGGTIMWFVGDFNGDGKTDIAVASGQTGFIIVRVARSTGAAFIIEDWMPTPGSYDSNWNASYAWAGDFNGDGKTDLATASGGTTWVWRSNGSKFSKEVWTTTASKWGGADYTWPGDFNGDGKTDIATASGGTIWVKQSKPFPVDLVTTVYNGLGGATEIAYVPSSHWENTSLPFSIQTVSAVTECDKYDRANKTCMSANPAITNYYYEGGFYYTPERDFRGFNYVKVTNPAGPNGEQSITETWYHQGNGSTVDINNPAGDVNDPEVPDGYMKGKPYRTRVTDGQGLRYSEHATNYAADDTAPYVNLPSQLDALICEKDVCSKQTRVTFAYDDYGNKIRKDQYGDLSVPTDDHTVVRSYGYNTTSWIVGLPIRETTYQGTYPGIDTANLDPAKKMRAVEFYYDGAADCAVASTNQVPTRGMLTRTVRWYSDGPDPEVRMGYDPLGNRDCTRDARGYTSTVEYDSTFTFATASINPKLHRTETEYYGVDTVPADLGQYGQVKSVIDPNLTARTAEYDPLGRKKRTIAPDDHAITYTYSDFGTVGLQHIRVDSAIGFTTWTYFDGLSRVVLEKKTGPAGKRIVTEMKYNSTGTVSEGSIPYFEGLETRVWRKFTYDSLDRVTLIENPDETSVVSCYDVDVTVSIDPNKHRRRHVKDSSGKVVRIDEYFGEHTVCTTAEGTPYATTRYEYDMMGSLRMVTDAESNVTEIHYDTLGRKDNMKDPDMGYWEYGYDENGNLVTQLDPKLRIAGGTPLRFEYDELNRLTKKDYPTGADVDYVYDEATSTYPIGRLTTMSEASGTTKYYYDKLGRADVMERIIDGETHFTSIIYDGFGRMTGIVYPDGEIVGYGYDAGGNLTQVIGYATFTDYDALGQPGKVTYGNNTTTTYDYSLLNKRLKDIITTDPTGLPVLSMNYDYDDNGNVTGIADNIDSARTQSFIYDELNRLRQAYSDSYGTIPYNYDQTGNILLKGSITYQYSDDLGTTDPIHAVLATSDGKTYTYDDNGNMESDSIRTITYDYDNKPDTVTLGGSTTRFVYDGNGARIKKITPTDTTLYVGKLYECKASACSKYIFAGGKRIALKASVTDILYYHQDHLGSSRIVTDATGEVKEEVFYDPFGATRADVGTVSVNHKYTSQEFDAETGLYFYNARYYDPVLGRFISPDTIVPRFADPQSLNRYSYVNNNPLNYIDPSGHGLRRWLKRLRQQQNLRKVHKAIFNPGTLSDEYWRRALSHTMIRVVANVVVQYYGGPLGSGVLSGYMSYLNDGTTGDIIKSAVISFASSWVNKQISAYKADDWIGTYIAKPVAKGIFSGAIAGLGGRDPWKTMYETAAVDFALSAGGDAILGPDVTDNAKIQEYLEENREYYLNKYDMVVNISDITVRKGGLWELLRPGTRAEMFVNTINIDAALIGSVDLMGVLRHELFHVYTYNLYGTIPFAISYLENAATWEQITRTMSGCCFK